MLISFKVNDVERLKPIPNPIINSNHCTPLIKMYMRIEQYYNIYACLYLPMHVSTCFR